MIIDQSSLKALYEIISSPNEINSDDDTFITLLNSTAYRELWNDKIENYSADNILEIINAYKEFKFKNISEEQHRFTNSRLQAFDENYLNHKIEISNTFNNSKIEAFQYLPTDFIYSEPIIALGILFLEQELAYSLNSCIIINYTNTIDFNEFNQKILAHELHHYYANQVCKLTDDIFNKDIMGNIFLFIVQMANEGMAHLITMPFSIKFPEMIGETGYKIVNEFKYVKSHVEEFINILRLDDKNIESLDPELLDLRKNGMVFHILSYYIVNKIHSVFGNDIIYKIIENPLTLLNYSS